MTRLVPREMAAVVIPETTPAGIVAWLAEIAVQNQIAALTPDQCRAMIEEYDRLKLQITNLAHDLYRFERHDG